MTLINSDQCDPLIKSLGKSLNTEIKFVSIGIGLEKSKDGKKKNKERTIIIFFGKEKFYIFIDDFKECKLSFYYLNIKTIYLDKYNKNVLLLQLDKNAMDGKNKIRGFYIFVKDRVLFVKSLLCYHSTYLMYKKGEVDELPIKEKNFEMILNNDSILHKGKTILHNVPDGFIRHNKNGFE
jgi:hypothetical protein